MLHALRWHKSLLTKCGFPKHCLKPQVSGNAAAETFSSNLKEAGMEKEGMRWKEMGT